jgi:hypothetical protein
MKGKYAPVPKTGQTTSYGNDTRDDGALRKGVAWPTPRFTDNNNNTVTDNLTGLIRMKDTQFFGLRNWTQARMSHRLALRHISTSEGRADMTPPLVWVDSLLLAILVFFVALLRIFLGLFGLLLSLVLLTFVSHSFLLGFSWVLNPGQFLFFNGWGRLREGFNLLK